MPRKYIRKADDIYMKVAESMKKLDDARIALEVSTKEYNEAVRELNVYMATRRGGADAPSTV